MSHESQGIKILKFNLNKYEFGLPIEYVREIINICDISKLPNAPSYFIGVINLRNTIIPVIELSSFLHFNMMDEPRERIIIIENKLGTIGLLAKHKMNILKITEQDNVTPTDPLKLNIKKTYLSSIVNINKQMIMIINVETILDVLLRAKKEQKKLKGEEHG